MPTTIVRVRRVDHKRLDGRFGPFEDFLIDGSHNDAIPETVTFQVHTTSPFMASVCERALQLERPVSILWKDGRIGRVMVDVELLPALEQTA